MLVTDDDASIRVFLKMLLECEGFEVIEAANGRQAVELARRERPDLLITDLDMPQVDGYTAIAQVRRDRSLAMMPILVHSGENGPGVEQLVLQLGADGFVPKSFDAATIIARVHMALRRSANAACAQARRRARGVERASVVEWASSAGGGAQAVVRGSHPESGAAMIANSS